MRLAVWCLLLGCGEYELRDEMSYEKLSDVRPGHSGSLVGIPCDELCRGKTANHVGFVSCNEIAIVASPHLECVLTNPGKRKEPHRIALPLPSGLDPATRGELDNKWCPREACVAPVANYHDVDAATEVVSACRIHVVDPGERFVGCTARRRYSRGALGP